MKRNCPQCGFRIVTEQPADGKGTWKDAVHWRTCTSRKDWPQWMVDAQAHAKARRLALSNRGNVSAVATVAPGGPYVLTDAYAQPVTVTPTIDLGTFNSAWYCAEHERYSKSAAGHAAHVRSHEKEAASG